MGCRWKGGGKGLCHLRAFTLTLGLRGYPEDMDLMDQKVLQLEQSHAENDSEVEEKWVGLEEH